MRWPGGRNDILIRAKQSLLSLFPNDDPSTACLGQHNEVGVLAIMPSQQDRKILEEATKSDRWHLWATQNWTESVVILEKHTPTIVLLNRNSLGSDWRDLLRFLLLPKHLCCIVLTTATTGDRFCEQFLVEGGYEVLRTPLRSSEVVEALQRASVYWQKCLALAYGY